MHLSSDEKSINQEKKLRKETFQIPLLKERVTLYVLPAKVRQVTSSSREHPQYLHTKSLLPKHNVDHFR